MAGGTEHGTVQSKVSITQSAAMCFGALWCVMECLWRRKNKNKRDKGEFNTTEHNTTQLNSTTQHSTAQRNATQRNTQHATR